jgi:hypothetical protein
MRGRSGYYRGETQTNSLVYNFFKVIAMRIVVETKGRGPPLLLVFWDKMVGEAAQRE